MWSTCSIETGHSWMQAPHVTQSQTTSSVTAPGTSGDASPPASTAGPSANSRSRRPMIRSFGERSLPVAHAGQTSWQRPHSVHDIVSTICFQVRSASVPAPSRSCGLVLDLEVERLEPAARPRPAEPDVDPGRRDVEVLRAGQVDEEAEDRQDVHPDEDPLAHLEPVARRPSASRSPRETGDHSFGHSLIPSAIRDACQQRSVVTISAIRPRIRSASPRWLPSKRAGPLHLADQERGRHADEHEDAEDVDEEEEPALVTEPRDRPVAVDRAEERHHDRREEDDEPPEDQRVDDARDEALEELPLAERRSSSRRGRAGATSPPRSTGLPIRTRR